MKEYKYLIPDSCAEGECIFYEHFDSSFKTCRFYVRLLQKSFPYVPHHKKPDYCKAQKVVIYYEE